MKILFCLFFWLLFGFLAIVIICATTYKDDEVTFLEELKYAFTDEINNTLPLMLIGGLIIFIIVVLTEISDIIRK